MKIKLLILIGMTAVPLLSIAQLPVEKAVFFNKGKMSVVGTGSANTVLYVDGDFIASRDADAETLVSDIYLESSKIVITGNLYQNAPYDAVSGTPVASHIFSLPANYSTSNRSIIEFRGTALQRIGTRLTNFNLKGTPSKFIPAWKATNYIDFPDIMVNNSRHVVIAPEIGASVKSMELAKGRLILDSRRRDNLIDEATTVSLHTEQSSSLLAHLLVDESATITYNRTPKTDINEYGAIEVRVALDSVPNFDDNSRMRNIVGMGSPFEEIKGDYFFWNFLMYPYGNNIFGYWNNSISDPNTIITAGMGFVVGIDLRGTDESKYIPYHKDIYNSSSASFEDRAKYGYRFGRFAYNNYNNYHPLAGMKSATQHATDNPTPYTVVADPNSNDAYKKENLNYTDVEKTLIAGFNYLANPFTTPLDLSLLIDDRPSSAGGHGSTTGDWGVTKNQIGGDIAPYVWVLNPSSVASGLRDGGGNDISNFPVGMEKLYASYTYLLLRHDGSTYVSEDADDGVSSPISIEGSENIIAPLQMFVIYSYKDKSAGVPITIPASQRVLSSGANFLRSANSSLERKDDFLFEVIDQSTKAFDRTAVVLRSPDEVLRSTSVEKMITSVTESADDIDAGNLRTMTETGKVYRTVNSALYTTDIKGNALESKFLAAPEGVTEVSTPLYLSPSTRTQTENIIIRAKRLNTMEHVTSIWLIDNLKNKEFELSSGEDYVTTVNATDNHDRFLLRFGFSPMGIEDEIDGSEKNINSYYANGELTVSGFEDEDMGSIISVYDIQGRMLRQAKVNELTMKISEVFYPGAYIVKVVGNKSYVSKFLVR